ncbi:MAG TPA: hypothetical protein PK544_09645 [Spirochaetota bacterium]|nr:hypothetical protein [Spirochaetota bacterium]HPJ38922.1 hypothetical protein [Spirochaetota bacterium]
MHPIQHLEASAYSLDDLISRKGNRKVFVVFSTCGERECDLICDKVRRIREGTSGLVDSMFLSHRREGEDRDRTEKRVHSADPDIEILINNTTAVPDMEWEKGKGSDMRRALFQINRDYMNGTASTDIIVVFLDADVLPEYFGSHFVIGLVGAVMDGYDFAKASFWRAMGRVKKYVAQPLFSLIDHPKIGKLTDFAYPLSGEVAGTLDFFNSVNFWQLYGIETGINIDSCFGGYRIADVNLGLYDHKHQSDLNIQKMAFGIIRTFFYQLIDNGILHLDNEAKIGDIFRANYIDENGERKSIECSLSEKKYQPLKNIL